MMPVPVPMMMPMPVFVVARAAVVVTMLIALAERRALSILDQGARLLTVVNPARAALVVPVIVVVVDRSTLVNGLRITLDVPRADFDFHFDRIRPRGRARGGPQQTAAKCRA